MKSKANKTFQENLGELKKFFEGIKIDLQLKIASSTELIDFYQDLKSSSKAHDYKFISPQKIKKRKKKLIIDCLEFQLFLKKISELNNIIVPISLKSLEELETLTDYQLNIYLYDLYIAFFQNTLKRDFKKKSSNNFKIKSTYFHQFSFLF